MNTESQFAELELPGKEKYRVREEWKACDPDEVVEHTIDFQTGETTQRTVAECIEDYRSNFGVTRFWDKKRLWVLNWNLGYRRYL